ncbi:MAG: hypothetical protein R3B93_00070 [Bacteroidia bacterium]
MQPNTQNYGLKTTSDDYRNRVRGTHCPRCSDTLDVLVYGFLATEEEMLNKELNDILVISKLDKQDSDTLLQDENMKLVIAVKDTEKRMM